MKRLTMKDENGCFLTDKTATVTWNSLIGENRYRGEAVDRLAAIEDILGDEYELDDLKNAMWCKETVGMAFSEDTAPVERLRELWFADREGRCVVLPFKPPKWVYMCSKRFPEPAQAYYASAVNVLSEMGKGCVFGDTPEEAEAALKAREQDD